MFNLNPDKKMSFEEMIGMANGIIGMVTAGKSDLNSLSAEYIPKMVEAIKSEQEKVGNPLMLNLMLSEDSTHFIASVWELGKDGNANHKKSYPLNNITEMTEILRDLVSKNEENANYTLQPATEQKSIAAGNNDASAGDQQHNSGAERTATEPGSNSAGGAGGLLEQSDSERTQA